MNPTRLMLIALSILVGILTFAILGNTNVYAQQSSTTASSIYIVGTNVECPKGYHENGRTTLGLFCDKDTSTAKTSLMTPTTTKTIAGGSAATKQLQQHPAIVRMNNNNLVSTSNAGWANLSPISNLSNDKSSPSLSPIAPQVNTIKQQGQPQLLTSNNTAIQNYTFSLTSQTADPGKLIYIGYHGNTTDTNSSTAKRSTATTITSKPEGDKSTATDTASSGHGSSTHTSITSKLEGDHSTRDISSKDNEKGIAHDSSTRKGISTTSSSKLHTIHSTNSDNGSKDKEGSSSHTKSSDQKNDNSKTPSSQSNSHIHKDSNVSNKAKKSNSSSKRNNNGHNHGN